MPNNKRVSDECVIAAYEKHGSIHKAAPELGIGPSSVHERLVRLGKNKSNNVFTASENDLLRSRYSDYADRGELCRLAAQMGRSKTTICRQAKKLGLTDQRRSKDYFSVWKNKSEEELWPIWQDFKRSDLGLGEYCRSKGIDDLGFWQAMSNAFPEEYECVIELKKLNYKLYRIGRRFEHQVANDLRGKGYMVYPSPGSRTPADLVAAKVGSLIFIQCRVIGYVCQDEWNALLELASSVSGMAVIAQDDGHGSPAFFEITAAKDGSRKEQPMRAWCAETVEAA